MTLKTALVTLSLVLSVLIGLLLARGGVATTAAGANREAPLIGFSMDTLKEARWQRDRDVFVQKAKSLGARDVLVQSANGDDTRQVNDIASLITAGIDVLVIVPHDGAAMTKGVRMAKDAGIPVIAYDRMIQSPDLDLYISFDNVAVGRLQAKYLVEHLPTPGRGKIVRIYGSKTDNNAKLFKQGQDEVIAPLIERGDIEVVWEDWAEDWKPENAKKIVNSAISAKGKAIDAILASNDGTAGGAIQALSEEGLAGKVLVTGQDAELVAAQRIVAGTQAMTIYKPLQKLASQAAELAVKMARGQPVVATQTVDGIPAVLADTIAVDRSNIDAVIIGEGFHKREEVYGK